MSDCRKCIKLEGLLLAVYKDVASSRKIISDFYEEETCIEEVCKDHKERQTEDRSEPHDDVNRFIEWCDRRSS